MNKIYLFLISLLFCTSLVLAVNDMDGTITSSRRFSSLVPTSDSLTNNLGRDVKLVGETSRLVVFVPKSTKMAPNNSHDIDSGNVVIMRKKRGHRRTKSAFICPSNTSYQNNNGLRRQLLEQKLGQKKKYINNSKLLSIVPQKNPNISSSCLVQQKITKIPAFKVFSTEAQRHLGRKNPIIKNKAFADITDAKLILREL